jgi:branched-chain amino acid transport system ATP-binding protein
MDQQQQEILEVKNLFKDFGGLEVLTDVNLSVREHERHAIIGPNGAGKTTLFKIISGQYKPSAGSITYRNQDVTGRPPYYLNRIGLSRSFQVTNIFRDLSVFKNIQAGVRCRQGLRYHFFRNPDNSGKINRKTEVILEQTGLLPYRDAAANSLSYGQQRALEIAITLSTEPDLIILDEPTAGMTKEETQEAVKLIGKISENRTLIIIEHDMDVIFNLADTISVLYYGSILVSGSPEMIRNDQRVKDAYLGGEEESVA